MTTFDFDTWPKAENELSFYLDFISSGHSPVRDATLTAGRD